MSMIRSTIRKISSLFRIRRQEVFVCSGLQGPRTTITHVFAGDCWKNYLKADKCNQDEGTG